MSLQVDPTLANARQRSEERPTLPSCNAYRVKTGHDTAPPTRIGFVDVRVVTRNEDLSRTAAAR